MSPVTLPSTEWRLIKSDSSEETDFLDATVVKAFNRFANRATAIIMDIDGTKALTYVKGYLVQIDAHPGGTADWEALIGGFVVDTIRHTDTLEIHILSHDFWLRKRSVFKNYTSKTISYILDDLIDDLTPLDWDAGLVSILNDLTVTRTWKGEKLDVVIRELANLSGDEEFGALSNRKFFFRQQQTETADRDFNDGEYSEAEWPERKQDEANKVSIYYGQPGSTGIVTVQDLAKQAELQALIGASDPVVIEMVANYPEVDNEDAARAKGYALLASKNLPLIGKLNSWNGYEITPGEVTHVEDPDSDIDGSFRIASIEYSYLNAETLVQVVEDYEGVLDTLVRMNEEVVRIDMKAADITATVVETVSISQPYKLAVTVKAYKQTVPDTMFIFGEQKGGLGDPAVGGGYLGDSRGNKTVIL